MTTSTIVKHFFWKSLVGFIAVRDLGCSWLEANKMKKTMRMTNCIITYGEQTEQTFYYGYIQTRKLYEFTL